MAIVVVMIVLTMAGKKLIKLRQTTSTVNKQPDHHTIHRTLGIRTPPPSSSTELTSLSVRLAMARALSMGSVRRANRSALASSNSARVICREEGDWSASPIGNGHSGMGVKD